MKHIDEKDILLVFNMYTLPRIVMEMYRQELWTHDKAVDELIALSTPKRKFTKATAASYLSRRLHDKEIARKRRTPHEEERKAESIERVKSGERGMRMDHVKWIQADEVPGGSKSLDDDLPY